MKSISDSETSYNDNDDFPDKNVNDDSNNINNDDEVKQLKDMINALQHDEKTTSQKFANKIEAIQRSETENVLVDLEKEKQELMSHRKTNKHLKIGKMKRIVPCKNCVFIINIYLFN